MDRAAAPTWARAFEPGARTVGDIGQRGLAAAHALVERFLGRLDGEPDTPPEGGQSTGATSALTDLGAEVARLVWQQLGDATPSARRTSPAEVLRIDGAAMACGQPTVWLHNTTPTDVTALRPHASDLTSSCGTGLGAAVRFEPATVPTLAAGSSLPLRITVDDAPAAPPGTYRGVVLVEGLVETWLVLEVVVPP